jgi:hypothetical protein
VALDTETFIFTLGAQSFLPRPSSSSCTVSIKMVHLMTKPPLFCILRQNLMCIFPHLVSLMVVYQAFYILKVIFLSSMCTVFPYKCVLNFTNLNNLFSGILQSRFPIQYFIKSASQLFVISSCPSFHSIYEAICFI